VRRRQAPSMAEVLRLAHRGGRATFEARTRDRRVRNDPKA
jgi:hypothetical protein